MGLTSQQQKADASWEAFTESLRRQMDVSKQKPTVAVLRSLKPEDRTACLMGWVDSQLKDVGGTRSTALKEVLPQLPSALGRFYVAFAMEAEVANGGFDGFVGNDPELLPFLGLAAECFEEMNQAKAAQAARELLGEVTSCETKPGSVKADEEITLPTNTAARLDRKFGKVGWCFERDRIRFIDHHLAEFVVAGRGTGRGDDA